MKVKMKIGMGMKMKTKKKTVKKRILPVAKRGSILPILPMLDALGSLIDETVGMAKVVKDGKASQRQLGGATTPQSCDGRSRTVSRSVQIWKRCVSRPVQTRTGCNKKEKKTSKNH